jgi:hypothetical protein
MKNENEPSVIFGKNILFTRIFLTFGIATRLWNLIICFLALIIIVLAGVLMDLTKPVVVAKDALGNSELEVFINNSAQVDSYITKHADKGQRKGVFSTLWFFAERKFQGAVSSVFKQDVLGVLNSIREFLKALVWAVKHHVIYSILFFAICLCMISIAGGAVCRTAALQFAQGQKPGMTEATRYSLKKFRSYFSSPLTPVCFIIACALLIFILGVLVTIPFGIGEVIMIIFVPLTFVFGIVITILLIGAIAGFNLMFPAIAYEGTDSFGAMNNSFCYIYKKPWRMAFYTTIATVYGAICYAFVRFFVFLLLWITHQSMQFGSKLVSSISNLFNKESDVLSKFSAIWPEPSFQNLFGVAMAEPVGSMQIFTFYVMHVIIWIFVLLLASFIMSFYFSANSIIYALMRNQVDNTPMNDIYAPQDIEEADGITSESIKVDSDKEVEVTKEESEADA